MTTDRPHSLRLITVPAGQPILVSNYIFRRTAREYLKCYQGFKERRKARSAPFFLCCRAIELALKATLLEQGITREELKHPKKFGHDLMKAYNALDAAGKVLVPQELALLAAANDIYCAKEFEYLGVWDAGTKYRGFPNMKQLSRLARKLVPPAPPRRKKRRHGNR